MLTDEEHFSLEEEQQIEEPIQDWSAINRFTELKLADHDNGVASSESLPKRSGKYFDKDGSEIQKLKLDSARDQMFFALLHPRGHHSKQLLSGVWLESKNKAFIVHAKGSFFKDIGKPHVYKLKKKAQGMWLSGIEALYLVERGSLIMYLADDTFMTFMEDEGLLFNYATLTPVTLAHLHSMVLRENAEYLDQYKVYSLLKRLGYLVMDPEDSNLPIAEGVASIQMTATRFVNRSFASLVQEFFINIGYSSRRYFSSVLCARSHYFNFTLVFQSLILKNSNPTQKDKPFPYASNTKYRAVFNVWKPSANFSKRRPPVPDYQVGILRSSKTSFPTLESIENACDEQLCNAKYKSVDRSRKMRITNKKFKTSKSTKEEAKLVERKETRSELRSRNEYLREKDKLLKHGSTGKSIVFAIIDDGIVNFTSFNETDFKLSSSLEELNKLETRDDHGIIWSERINSDCRN